MPTVQIRNLPEKIYHLLKARAKNDRRSIQQEAAWMLETMLLLRPKMRQPDWSGVDEIRERMTRAYGTLADSTLLIRQMRDER